jgi:hypothetical protein
LFFARPFSLPLWKNPFIIHEYLVRGSVYRKKRFVKSIMSIFTHAVPILPASNIPASMAFYDKLGFQRIWEDIEYGILRRDNIELHLAKCVDPRVAENSTCRFLVSGIEELYEVYSMLNVIHPNYPLQVEAWGAQSFGIQDPDGNLVKFVETKS